MLVGSVSRNDPMAITLKNLYSEVVICWPAAPGRTRERRHLDVFMRTHYDALRAGCAVLLLSLLWVTTMAACADFHVLGIVMVIDTKHIEVKTSKGSVVSVLINQQVKFRNKSNPKSNDPPAVGDRVIIEATKDDKTKKVSATVVHYSPVTTVPPPR